MSDRLEKNCGVLLAFSSRQGMATIFRSSGQLTVKKLTVFRGLQPKSGDCVTEFCSGRSGCGLGSDICPKNLGNDVGVLAHVTSQLSQNASTSSLHYGTVLERWRSLQCNASSWQGLTSRLLEPISLSTRVQHEYPYSDSLLFFLNLL